MDRYIKSEKLSLKDSSEYDEQWLKDKIEDDPALLGLGNLELIEKERRQITGGKIDFLFKMVDTDTFYEVEVQLGKTDESHIIRTIEYWDNERRKNPGYDHRAVIIAENITTRFFNVIQLLNKSVPIIAIQVNALKINDIKENNEHNTEPLITLDFQKVLDISGYYGNEVDQQSESTADTTNYYYKKEEFKESLSIIESFMDFVKGIVPELKLSRRNKNHIAYSIGSSRQLFYCQPRKNPQFRFTQKILDEDIETARNALENIDISPSFQKGEGETSYMNYSVNKTTTSEHPDSLKEIIQLTG